MQVQSFVAESSTKLAVKHVVQKVELTQVLQPTGQLTQVVPDKNWPAGQEVAVRA